MRRGSISAYPPIMKKVYEAPRGSTWKSMTDTHQRARQLPHRWIWLLRMAVHNQRPAGQTGEASTGKKRLPYVDFFRAERGRALALCFDRPRDAIMAGLKRGRMEEIRWNFWIRKRMSGLLQSDSLYCTWRKNGDRSSAERRDCIIKRLIQGSWELWQRLPGSIR